MTKVDRSPQRREKRRHLAAACVAEIERKSELELAEINAKGATLAMNAARQIYAAELVGDVIEDFEWETSFAEQHAESFLVAFVDKLLSEATNMQGVMAAIRHAYGLAQKHQGKASRAELEWIRKNREEPVDDAEAEA